MAPGVGSERSASICSSFKGGVDMKFRKIRNGRMP
jgi:hypothetical protein